MSSTISQQKIADELKVHVTLVSKVLNGRMGTSGVSPELAQRIRATAQAMGYRKNQNAAALRSGRHQVIAAYIDRRMGAAGSGIIEDLVAGISVGARDHQQRQIISFYDSVDDFRRIARSLNRGAVDGLVVAGLKSPELSDEVHRIQASGVPVATVFNDDLGEDVPNIKMHDAEIIRLATRHLIAQGRRRILHLSCSRAHEAGYVEALREAGLEVRPELIQYDFSDEINFTREQGERAVRRAIDAGIGFDAVCAQSDTQAIGAMYVLIRQGLRVPEDVMITGVDDSPLAKQAFIPLTSVNQCFERRGRLAIDMLTTLIAGKEAPPVVVEPVLVPRESTFTPHAPDEQHAAPRSTGDAPSC